jgi:uncharacterized membrane protein YraQ (UPF0718 family)/copper chaperone CopZ
MIEFITGIAAESFVLLARMAPYLLLGILVAGALHLLLPVGTVARHLGGRGLGSVFKASALGVPLPLCSCGVVPVAASLKKSGASSGATVGFLVTTPTSGVDSILATYSLLGGAFTLLRVIVSFLIGLVAGIATSLGLRRERDRPDEIKMEVAPANRGEDGRNWVVGGLAYGFGELLGGIARPLFIGTLLGGVIAYLLPPGILGEYVGTGLLSYLVMLAVGVPLYVCASGSIPLAAALMAKGISPGAALIFLLVGPATNAASITMVSSLLGRRALFIYLGLLVGGSFAAGIATDAFFGWFPALLPDFSAVGFHDMSGLSLLEILSGTFLGALTLYHLGRQIKAKLSKPVRPSAGEVVLKVPDMTCQHCASTITSAAGKVPGVGNVRADPATKLVILNLSENANAEAAVEAIQKAGYHPVEEKHG